MERNLRTERVGLVVSDKMDKPVVVAIVDTSQPQLHHTTIPKTKTNKALDQPHDRVLLPTVPTL